MEVGGYIRVSSRAQRDQSDSPASQRQRLTDAGATIIFEDLAVSGYRLNQRRKAVEFQRMWRAIETGQLRRLLATRLDRFARRDQIVLELAQHCERHGVEFVTLGSGAVDTSTATGWLSVKVQLMFAEHYSRQLSENIKTGFAGLHAQGIPASSGAALPWHLQRDPGTRHGVIRGPGWDDARYAVEQLMAGAWGLTDVARYIHPKHGVMRSHNAVRAWLERPAILGHLVRNQGKADEVVIRDCWPALVTLEEQQQALWQLGQRGRIGKGRSGARSTKALSGLCVCAACGGTLRLNTRLKVKIQREYLRCINTDGAGHCRSRMAPAGLIERQLHSLLGPHIDQLIRQQAEQRKAIEPPPEVVAWRRELQMREAIPVEFRQPADQARITELQKLISAGSLVAGVDQGELLRLQGEALDPVRWFDRPGEDRNTDLRALVTKVVVATDERQIARVDWVDGTTWEADPAS